MSFNGKTFKFRLDQIKSNSGLENSQFATILFSYIVNDLKISRNDIDVTLELLDCNVNNE